MANTPDKVIKIAMDEIGYLEKSAIAYRKDPSVLYEKTRGAGFDNYTKYNKEMHDEYPSVMDFPAPYCDCLVDWCFLKAYGVSTAKSLLGGNFDDYTVASAMMYEKKNAIYSSPEYGDQVFFTKNGKVSGCYHTGLVYKVDDTYFYTIEGNTSGASGVVANGGGVTKKKYSISAYKGKVIFGRPKYDKEEKKPVNKANTAKKTVSEIAKEVIDGKWGNGTDRTNALKAAGYNVDAVQTEVNKLLSGKTQAVKKKYRGTFPKLPARGYFTKGDTGTQVRNLQNFLNWATDADLDVDGYLGALTIAAVIAFEKLVFPKDNKQWDGEFGKKCLEKAKAFTK